jgi:hypothetical protein
MLLEQIAKLDFLADTAGLDEEAWALRYHLEADLLHIYSQEEEYWRQRGRVKWALQGTPILPISMRWPMVGAGNAP